ncbi:MAG: hypothetical protein KAJ58_01250 [Candidatus Pacebacteria bacterium]|nr:hypothetical protein [Candidatus Paceibacterota bacterium]
MKIFIICSKVFYDKIPAIEKELENNGHIITLPNCFDNPEEENLYKELGRKEHSKWKSLKIKESEDKIKIIDAVLVLNFKKNEIKNYIGGATFLEMHDTFKLNKKIFMYNNIPDGILHDEIVGFSPVIINQNLNLIK